MPGTSTTLGHLYRSLRHGGKTEAEALAAVTWLLANDKTTTPPVPPGARPELHNGSLVIMTTIGTFDGDAFFTPPAGAPPRGIRRTEAGGRSDHVAGGKDAADDKVQRLSRRMHDGIRDHRTGLQNRGLARRAGARGIGAKGSTREAKAKINQ